MVSIPSETTPNWRKNDDSAHMIQPVIAFNRRVKAVAAATTPMLASPCIHRASSQPTTPTINSPFSTTSPISINVEMRIST